MSSKTNIKTKISKTKVLTAHVQGCYLRGPLYRPSCSSPEISTLLTPTPNNIRVSQQVRQLRLVMWKVIDHSCRKFEGIDYIETFGV